MSVYATIITDLSVLAVEARIQMIDVTDTKENRTETSLAEQE